MILNVYFYDIYKKKSIYVNLMIILNMTYR